MFKLYLFLLVSSSQAIATVASEPNLQTNNILWLSLLVIAAIFSLIANKYRQSTVLGQLIIGALIGTLAHFNLGVEIITNQSIGLIAQLGSIFLLFEIGLESNFFEIKTAGKHAIQVAAIGVIVPFCLGYFIVTPYIIRSDSHNLALFIGGILAVTSTSISVSVFKELGIIRNKACQIVLTASVIDDIIGLILLSVIVATASVGSVDRQLLLFMLAKVVLFFMVCYFSVRYILPKILLPWLSKLGKGENISTLFIVAICLTMSWFAEIIGFAAIIGAFFAGLMLDNKKFAQHKLLPVSEQEGNQPLTNLILPLGRVLTPIFFIYAGMQVDLINAFKFNIILMAILISIFAIIGKVACCITLPKQIHRLIVGFGMVPRGEIGIIFAVTGLNIGVIDHDLFTALLLVIVITSMITPIALNKLSHNIQKP